MFVCVLVCPQRGNVLVLICLCMFLVQDQTCDLERQLQVVITEKQHFSDQFNSTMTELRGEQRPTL
jgi:hypothetical protein